MRIVYSSFYGRYSDNPRAIHEALVPHLAARGVEATHVWLQDPEQAQGFPAGVAVVPYGGDEARAQLEAADVLIATGSGGDGRAAGVGSDGTWRPGAWDAVVLRMAP